MASNVAFVIIRALRRLQLGLKLELVAYNHFKANLVLFPMQQILTPKLQ